MQRERERVDGGRDRGRRRRRVATTALSSPVPAAPWTKSPTGRPVASPIRSHELLGQVRQQRVGRVVDDHAGRAELGNLLRALDERVDLARARPALKTSPTWNSLPGGHDRLARLPQVRDVVERIVEPEDVDPVLGRTRDEAAHDVGRDRARADEEAAAEGEAERRRRARVDRADPLPGALDRPPDGRVEDAAARDLEVGEARTVEDLRDPQHLAGRQLARERVLREQADGGVDDLRHLEVGPYRGPRRPASAGRPGRRRVTRARCSAPRAGRP